MIPKQPLLSTLNVVDVVLSSCLGQREQLPRGAGRPDWAALAVSHLYRRLRRLSHRCSDRCCRLALCSRAGERIAGLVKVVSIRNRLEELAASRTI